MDSSIESSVPPTQSSASNPDSDGETAECPGTPATSVVGGCEASSAAPFPAFDADGNNKCQMCGTGKNARYIVNKYYRHCNRPRCKAGLEKLPSCDVRPQKSPDRKRARAVQLI